MYRYTLSRTKDIMSTKLDERPDIDVDTSILEGLDFAITCDFWLTDHYYIMGMTHSRKCEEEAAWALHCKCEFCGQEMHCVGCNNCTRKAQNKKLTHGTSMCRGNGCVFVVSAVPLK